LGEQIDHVHFVFLRQGGAVGPNCVGDVARYVEADVFGGEGGFKLAFGGQRQHGGRPAPEVPVPEPPEDKSGKDKKKDKTSDDEPEPSAE